MKDEIFPLQLAFPMISPCSNIKHLNSEKEEEKNSKKLDSNLYVNKTYTVCGLLIKPRVPMNLRAAAKSLAQCSLT